jgi:hypothetical protein
MNRRLDWDVAAEKLLLINVVIGGVNYYCTLKLLYAAIQHSYWNVKVDNFFMNIFYI